MNHDLLSDIGITIIFAAILGVCSHFLKQPILLALIACGALLGPTVGFGLVASPEHIEVISELGLIFLLFIIGLEMNLKELRTSGKELLFAGIGQFPICFLLGLAVFPVFAAFGVFHETSTLQTVYLSIASALSSTAIVVKLLYDHKDLDTLPGKLTLGVLIFQDLFAIFVLALQPNIAHPTIVPVLQALGSTALLIVAGYFISKYVLQGLFRRIALSPEIVVSAALGWCASSAAAAEYLGLSKEMGALVAGLSISAFPFSTHIASRVLPLRDFFLTLFFVSLGMAIEMPTSEMVVPVIAISLFIIASRFLSIFPLVVAAGAGKRAAFLASLNLAQMSEFSLVIAALGVESGHISSSTMSLVTYTMVLTAILSSHAIKESHRIFGALSKLFSRDNGEGASSSHGNNGHSAGIVVLGCHRGAFAFLRALRERESTLLEKVVVIDFNPRSITELRRQGISTIFGDIGSFDILRHAGIEDAKVIVSSVPDSLLRGTNNSSIVRMARILSPEAVIAATANDEKHEQELLRDGAQVILRPYDLAGVMLVDRIRGLVVETQRISVLQTVTTTLTRRWKPSELEILQGKKSSNR